MHGPWDDYKDSTTSDNSGPWNDYASPKESSSQKPSAKSRMATALSRAFSQSENDAEGKYLPHHAISDARDVAQGAAEAIPSFVQNMQRAQDAATPDFIKKNPLLHSLLSQALGLPQPQNNKGLENTDTSKLTAPIGSGRHDLSSELFRGAGQAAIPLAGEDDMASEIAKAIPSAGKGVSSILGRLISGGAIGLSTPAQNGKEAAENVGTAAATNVAVPAAIENIAKIIEKLRPSKLLRGTLSPEELKANAEAAQGTPTALGDVVDSEGLRKTYENIISKLPFSGASGKMSSILENVSAKGKAILGKILGSTDLDTVNKNIATAGEAALKKVLNVDDISDTSGQLTNDAEHSLKQILGRDDLSDTNGQLANDGEEMLKNMFGGHLNPDSATQDLVENINKNYKEQDIAKGPLYKKRNQIADSDENFKMDPSLFAQEAKKYSSAIKATNLLKFEPEQSALFKRMERYKNPNSKGPTYLGSDSLIHSDEKAPTLGEAQILKGHLNELASKASSSSDAAQRGASKIFKSLAAKLNQDMENSIKASGNKELEGAHKAANENYIKNYLPFLNKNIFKIVNGKTDPDTVVNHLIKTGPDSDRSTLLSSGTKLPGNIRVPLAKAYFSRAFKNGKVIPPKLAKLTNDLGPNQLKELVPSSEERQSLKDYATYEKLQKKTGKSLHQNGMVDPVQVAKLADEFDKNPSERNQLIPDENRYSALQKYGQKYKTAKVFESALNQDGSINADKLANTIDSLEKNPKKFNEVVPDKQTQERLKNFSRMVERINHFKSASEAGAANNAKLASLAKLLAESNDKTNRLLSEDNQKELSSFQTLQNMNKNVPSVKANQPTGKTALDALIKVGIPALLGMQFGGITGAAAGAVLASGSGRALTHLLTSEKVRENLIKEMLANVTKFKGGGRKTKGLQAFAHGATNSIGAP